MSSDANVTIVKMKHIQKFLTQKNIFPELIKKEIAGQIIFEEVGCVIPPPQFSFSGNIVFIKTTPENKRNILFKKNNILNRFKKESKLSYYTELK